MYGKKADNLIKLKKQGFDVPGFDVVSHDQAVDKYVPSFAAELYAVRSSCSLEDSDRLSFAGQFDTFLNVKKEELKEKIKMVFDSYSLDKLYDYDSNIKNGKIENYVIVQQMISSDFSGVIFTSNPQGIINEMVILCGKGVGEKVVTDKVNTTTYYYNTDDEIYYYEGGNNYLSANQIQEIVSTAQKIVNLLGECLDIEYAIKDGILYILQARKITTIDSSSPLVFDNSNIVESYPGVSLPLTISFVHYLYAGVFKSAVSRILKNEKQIDSLQNVFNNMVGDCNGRLYYKIGNWYEIILRLPFSNKIIPIWQDMMGVHKSNVLKSQKSHASLKVYYNFLKELKHVPSSMESLNKKFDVVYSDYKKSNIKNLSYDEIIDEYHLVSGKLFPDWDITLFNDMYTFLYTGKLKKYLKKKYDNYEEIANKIIAGNKNLESLKPIKELINLAFSKNDNNYNRLFDDYISTYGDRCIEELKLETKTYRTDPELLEEKVQEFLNNKAKFEGLLKQINSDSEEKFDKKINNIVEKCKLGIKNREISRLNRTRIFGMCREMFLRLGDILCSEGVIEDKRDVFYLTLQELIEKRIDNNTKAIIDERKEKYKLYYKLPSYSRIVFSNREFNKSHVSINNEVFISKENELKGTPCSTGTCEGEAIIVENLAQEQDVKDKIIIARMTDPGWVFLIANAKGIISEKGSILSHTAIITRELHVPSIVGVKDLLKNVKTGDTIYMDANNGVIKIVNKKEG